MGTRVTIETKRKGRGLGALRGAFLLGPVGLVAGAAIGTGTRVKVRVGDDTPRKSFLAPPTFAASGTKFRAVCSHARAQAKARKGIA